MKISQSLAEEKDIICRYFTIFMRKCNLLRNRHGGREKGSVRLGERREGDN